MKKVYLILMQSIIAILILSGCSSKCNCVTFDHNKQKLVKVLGDGPKTSSDNDVLIEKDK